MNRDIYTEYEYTEQIFIPLQTQSAEPNLQQVPPPNVPTIWSKVFNAVKVVLMIIGGIVTWLMIVAALERSEKNVPIFPESCPAVTGQRGDWK